MFDSQSFFSYLLIISPLLFGWILDIIFADPSNIPHPIVGFGKLIHKGDTWLNKGKNKFIKGALMSVFLIVCAYLIGYLLARVYIINVYLGVFIKSITIFFCIAGTTLIREVKQVFIALNTSLEQGRKQVARIVGRDTNELTENEIKTAALETLSENLSDGVIAPLFWYGVLGLPGLLAYKMINTLDSMIGYRTKKHKDFGCFAAKIDDIANYIPARLTAILMLFAAGMKLYLLRFVFKYGKQHASPNSGYPEAALAGILNCRFGGGHNYFGQYFYKPYIGENERELNYNDLKKAVKINRITEIIFISALLILQSFLFFVI